MPHRWAGQAALREFAVDTRTLLLTMWVNATRPRGRQWFNRRSVRWIQLPEIKFPGGSDANGATVLLQTNKPKLKS